MIGQLVGYTLAAAVIIGVLSIIVGIMRGRERHAGAFCGDCQARRAPAPRRARALRDAARELRETPVELTCAE